MALRFLLALLFLAVVTVESAPVSGNVVDEILNKLADRADAKRITKYLKMSADDLKKALATGGEKYTFFAPTSQAFLSVIPQDIGDPFVIDDDFRLTMLLRHFSEEVLSEEELKKKTSLTMADTKAKVKITVEKDVVMVNGGMVSVPIELVDDLGIVYMIDQVFVSPQEVSDAIAKNPGPSIGFLSDPADDSKPPSVGGYSPKDPNDESVQEIAKFAAEQIAAKTNSGPLKIVKITSAASQVVAGQNYKLVMELVDAAKNDKPQICEVVVFDQVWTKTRELTSSKCNLSGDQASLDSKTQDDSNSKPTESARPIRQVDGGYTEAKVDDPDVKEMAEFAATQIAAKANSTPLKIVKINSAATQVVAGKNYKLTMELVDAAKNDKPQTCEVVIFDQSWTNTRKLTSSICSQPSSSQKTSSDPVAEIEPVPEPEPEPSGAPKSVRQAVGGFSDAKIDDPAVKEIAEFAAAQIASKANSSPLKVVKIKSAATQVVAGINYKLTLELVDATKNDKPQTCDVVVFDQSWTNTRELSSSNCDQPGSAAITSSDASVEDEPVAEPEPSGAPKSVRQVVGGYSPAKVDDPAVKEVAEYAALQLAAKTNSGPVKVVKITSAATQVVAGTNYKLSLQLQKAGDNESLSCEVIIFDQPWTNTRKLSESRCGPETVQKKQ